MESTDPSQFLLGCAAISWAAASAALFCRGPRKAIDGRRDWLWFGTALILLATMTLRQRKLLGEDLWRWLDLGGALHFGLIGMLVWLLRASRETRP